MSAAVAILPTNLAVEAAWERSRALKLALAGDASLADDADFMARLGAAEAEWTAAFEAWAGREWQ